MAAMSADFVYAAGDPAAGKAAYAVCIACHGAEGEGNVALNAPKIAGQEPWYLRAQMELFKSGARGTAPGDLYGMQMRPMAMTVATPQALEDLIAYIGTLPVNPSPVTVQGDVAAGKTGYAVCAACHGMEGEGSEAMGGPKLVGQNDWYTARQVENFKTNKRGYDPNDVRGMQMKPMAMVLADQTAINNVVAYLNSLQ